MYCLAAIIMCAILIVLTTFLPPRMGSGGGNARGRHARGRHARERYGPPPGMQRAVDHNELPGDRGWPGLDKVYEASTASSISHMIERSA
jgi:hypothetical protein